MKLAVIGSRGIYDAAFIYKTLDELRLEHQVSAIISGGARGVDSIAENWAKENGVETLIFKPDYQSYTPQVAPLVRNVQIVEACDKLVAYWDGQSRGSYYTIKQARKTGKLLEVYLYSSRHGWIQNWLM